MKGGQRASAASVPIKRLIKHHYIIDLVGLALVGDYVERRDGQLSDSSISSTFFTQYFLLNIVYLL